MQTKTNLQQILNVFEMATEEQKIELTNNTEELKEREKTESPAELLQSSLIGLDKYGGFQSLKGLIKGAENMDPRRKAVKNIFLSDSTYSEARKKLAKEKDIWKKNTNVTIIKST